MIGDLTSIDLECLIVIAAGQLALTTAYIFAVTGRQESKCHARTYGSLPDRGVDMIGHHRLLCRV
jgi:hypothetical protein